MNRLTLAFDQLKKNWIQLNQAKKTVFFGTFAGLLVLFTFIIFYTSRVDYSYLFTNLSGKDASRITEKLNQSNIDFKLEAGGSAILVASDKVHETRLLISGEGLPTGGGVGFELFDKGSIGMTEFIQKVNYKRALEGELARTISSIEGVEGARVHIVIPERSLFRDEKNQARASVVLRLRDDTSINKNQVQGILNLVASSIKEIKPTAITIVDHRGNVLNKATDDSESQKDMGLKDTLEYQKKFENKMENKVGQILERILGHGKAIVKVAADFNFDSISETQEKFNPDVQVVRSEQLTEETTETKGYTKKGTPGAKANLPQQEEAGPQSGSDSTGNKTVTIRNYEIEKNIRRTAHSTGNVERVSVSVSIDGVYEKDKEGNTVYKERVPAELKKLEDIIKNAVGFNQKRGDTVIVSNFRFHVPDDLEGIELAKELKQQKYISLALRYGLTALMVVILTVVLFKLVNFITTPEVEEMLPGFPKTIEELEEVEDEEEEEEVDKEEMRRVADEERQKVLEEQKASRKKIQEISKSNPVQTAEVIKGWLIEDEEEANKPAADDEEEGEGSAAG